MRTLARIGVVVVTLIFSLTTGAAPNQEAARFGLLEIGDTPTRKDIFQTTDCGVGRYAYGDCSATDRAGREYGFFDGILVLVTLNAKTARPPVRLPGGLIFGEDIRKAAARLSKALQLPVDGGPAPSGETVYSTDMIIPSRSGTRFQIVLVADKRGRLVEFTERINSI